MPRQHIKCVTTHEDAEQFFPERLTVEITVGRRQMRLYIEVDSRRRSTGEFRVETPTLGTTHFISL